jgi:hypothetical protein
MIKRFLLRLKLLRSIEEIAKKEPNDFMFAGKVRNLLDHFYETGEIKEDPKGRRL